MRGTILVVATLVAITGCAGGRDEPPDGPIVIDAAPDGMPDAAPDPRCGDGNVDPGEGCDDGNDVDDDACTNACALPTCGDGIVQPGEDCDDDNDVDTDACLTTCVGARCGDGHIWDGLEVCDDGNTVDEGVCSSDCQMSGCAPGTAACDQIDNNGCETNTNTSLMHCGGCDLECTLPNADPTCNVGSCEVGSCLTPYQNCNGLHPDGCEIDTSNDVNNCGGCTNSCLTPNTVVGCMTSTCVVLGCTGTYGDCTATYGCETDTATSMAHCGACNSPCALPFATETCAAGACQIVACTGTHEDCNTLDADGCEIDVSNDPAHCGACGDACMLANAVAGCASSDCYVASCLGTYSDCNGLDPDGCEIDLASNALNCGACGNDCNNVYPNSMVGCAGSTCTFNGCQPNWWNLDGNIFNGCEYACTFQGTDVPDNGFVDQNCDGIDGDAAAAIFVATSGNDANPGTRALPMQTIMAGISRAQSQGLSQVYVSNGVYSGRVTLTNGVSIHGGYSAANNWARSASYVSTIRSTTVANGRLTALEGFNITSATMVDRFTIETGSTTSTGISNYAVYCSGCTAVTFRSNDITAGNAGGGSSGASGGTGANGTTGGGGGAGSCDANQNGGAGGFAGGSSCGRSGGAGGRGGNYGDNDGLPGATGQIGTPGGNGGAGGDPGGAGGAGSTGTNGGTGSQGSGGSGGLVSGGFWVSGWGGGGGTGVHGNGGGGGGGGGGQGCFFCDDGPGNGGGGGGGAGCGGNGATGGTGGGGSFGVFLSNSTGVVLQSNTIVAGNGGAGGSGGGGGFGGTGANGGAGGTVCTGEVGRGGNGGRGGDGGRGGGGGGGAGGPSWAVYRSGTSVSTSGNSLSPGAGGAGGAGGAPNGNAGSTGQSGAAF